MIGNCEQEGGPLGAKGKTSCENHPRVKPSEMFAAPSPPSGIPAGKARGISVRAVLRDGDGKVLFLRRAIDSKRFGGQWELPGGKLNAGETIEDALRREVREEVGFEVVVGALLGATELELDRVKIVSLHHVVERVAGELQLSAEHSEFRWVARAEFEVLDLAPTVREFVLRRQGV